ncbi:hypothetical protein V1T76_28940 [Roseibium sp. FZY0029]|uniref:hypothetical protein n=1 Tax=Roseibium sp. FZY0029 TaxID=3116647 RepID=UPI002EA3CCB8|nr:hypothetical protein [Roseibium sp. FZY0029]
MSVAKKYGHVHGEAFMLMKYACVCGHRETIWNSRDGVTPFGMVCPSCGKPNLRHVNWQHDVYAPEHKLQIGQRFWRDGTPDEAEAIMRRRIEQEQNTCSLKPKIAEELIQSIRDGATDYKFRNGWPIIDQNNG